MMEALSRKNTVWDDYNNMYGVDQAAASQDALKMVESWGLSADQLSTLSPELKASIDSALQAQLAAADTPAKKYALMTSKYGTPLVASDNAAAREVGTYLATELAPFEATKFYSTYKTLPQTTKNIIENEMIQKQGIHFNASGELVKYQSPTSDPSFDYENYGSG